MQKFNQLGYSITSMNKKIFTLFCLLVSLLLLGSCQREEAVPKKSTVLISIAPYAYFVDKISEGTVQIECLVPEGANPHIYEPTPKAVERAQDAKLWLRLGESFDKKIDAVLKKHNPTLHVVNLTQGIELLSVCEEESLGEETHHCHEHGDEGKDIHIWLSPKLAKKQARAIAAGLIAIDPENEPLYTIGLKTCLSELDLLDQEITELLLPKKGSAILVSHPAFGYFCQDYDLIQLSVEMEGKDPLPQHITELLNQAKAYQITAVLLQPQYSNKGAELIAQELHLPTTTIDPYATNYIENLYYIAEIIAR